MMAERLNICSETILLQDPAVAGAVMFGRGRVQNGILIEPKEVFDPSDEERLAKFRNRIWYVSILPATRTPAHLLNA